MVRSLADRTFQLCGEPNTATGAASGVGISSTMIIGFTSRSKPRSGPKKSPGGASALSGEDKNVLGAATRPASHLKLVLQPDGLFSQTHRDAIK